jgi:toxin-antitoxin system PIN domain toxin
VTALPDVNVLLAVAWPNHQHHAAAVAWFESATDSGWATCALTELGFVRISANPSFTRQPASAASAIEVLSQLRKVGKHRYWNELPGADTLRGVALAGHQQVTDAYLLKLAESKRGLLVTFDRALQMNSNRSKHVRLLSPQP